jgi:hypothetical protein
MKKIITLLLVLSVFTVSAQKITLPDNSKISGRCYPQVGTPVPCAGVAYIKSVDLDWRPILVRKSIEIEHESANENIDSIKAAQFLLKLEYEKHGVKAEAKTTSVTPVIGTNMSGYAPDGSSPLDNSIAVSNGGIILSVENSTLSGFNVSGSALFTTPIHTFLPFTGVYGVCDPVVLYDPVKDRFIFFCQEIGPTGLFANNRIFVCFSQTNNPATGGWWCYSFAGDPTGSADGFDYPKLAINDSELFITGNLYYQPSNTFHRSMIFQMDKLAGFSGGGLSYVFYNTIVGSPFTLLPVSYGQNGNLTTGMLLVSTNGGGGSNINLYSIAGNWCCSPVMTYYTVATTPYTPPANALQLGTTTILNTGDCRALSGFFLDGIIHFVFNSSATGGYTGINYNRLTVSSLTNVSSTFGMTGFDCAYPSVASFATTTTDRSVMIGFGRSGSTITPEIRVVNCDNAMSWSSSTLVKTNAYVSYGGTSSRWGDYSGMSRRHTGTTPAVWMNGAYGNSAHHWTTWLAKVDTSTPPVCAMPTGLTATTITSTSALLSWTAAAGALSYNIKYRKVGTTPWTTTTSVATSKAISALTANTNYEYQVQTVCISPSTSAFTASSNFTTLTNASVAYAAANSSLRIYPNPVSSLFSVEFLLSTDSRLNISLVDMTGRLIKELYAGDATTGVNVFSFNKANLATGTYLLVIKANDATIRNEKIIITD